MSGAVRGFGSVINRHPETHGKTYFSTTHENFFGQPPRPTTQQYVAEVHEALSQQAGGHKRAYEDQRIKLISNLTGEVYSNSHDPQEKTDIQRSWLYAKDPAVTALNQRPMGPNGPPVDLKAT